MGKKRSSKYASLVAGFAASAFAMLMIVTAEQQTVQAEVSSLVRGSQTTTVNYQTARLNSLSRCARATLTKNRDVIARVCKTTHKASTGTRDSR